MAFAQQRIAEAFAQLRTAEVLWVPSLRAGVNYNKHEGNIQDVAGNIIDTSRGSHLHGIRRQAVGAGSPSVPGLIMNFHLRDAIFQPRIAEHVLGARQNASLATTNDQLLETALAYMDLLEALQTKVVTEETLASARRLAELTKSFADVGQGLRSDADRVQTEQSLREIEVRRADETVRVTMARLTRLLSHDQTLPLVPQEPSLVAIDLIEQVGVTRIGCVGPVEPPGTRGEPVSCRRGGPTPAARTECSAHTERAPRPQLRRQRRWFRRQPQQL